jgi:hypothetical protein
MKIKKPYLLTTLIGVLFSLTSHAEEGSFTISSGVDYSSGDYGQSIKTKIVYIPFSTRYDIGRWSLKATLPWLQIDGPGGVSGDGRVVTSNNITTRRTTESGQGDLVAGEQKFYVDLTAKVKLPTASESRGLGTGKTDYAFAADVYKGMGAVTALATLGYRVLGEPTGVNLDNVWFGTVGGVYKINGQNSVGLTADYREATTSTGSALREYTLFYSHKFDDTYKLQTYLVHGDTQSSIDWGGGMMLAVQLE